MSLDFVDSAALKNLRNFQVFMWSFCSFVQVAASSQLFTSSPRPSSSPSPPFIISLEHSNSGAYSFSLKTISRSKTMMSDVREPGELPLMKELTALKKPKASQTSSRKSPLRACLSSSTHTHEATTLQSEGQANLTREVDNHELQFQEYRPHGGRDASHAGVDTHESNVPARGAYPRIARSLQPTHHQTEHHFDPTSIRSSPMNDYNVKIMNWDSMGDAPHHGASSSRSFTERLQRESLQNHLERLGILGGGHGSNAHMVKESSLLHNWKNVDEGLLHTNQFENFELEQSPHAWNRRESAQGNAATKSRSDNFFAHQDDQNVGKYVSVSQKASVWQEDGRGLNAQTLSPLALHPQNENHRIGQYVSKPNFRLEEEPLDEDNAEDQLQYEKEESLWPGMTGGYRGPRSPLRTQRKQTTTKCSRSFEMYSPPFGFRPGTSETEFLEYDVETLEQPSKWRDRPTNRKNTLKEHSYSREQHAEYPFEPLKRNSALAYEGRPSSKRKNQLKASYMYNRSPEMLTELEDYNGSDEYGETSVDGEFGRSSINDHERELQLARRRTHGVGGHGGAETGCTGGTDRLQLAVRDCKELALCESHPRCLSQKYRPKSFEAIVGQPIVTQALSNAIVKGRIAPVYLFQGSRGTGKTTAARIFASGLVCIAHEGQRPCGMCRECVSVAKGINSEVKEVDAASNNGIERVKMLLEETISAPPLSRYKVFIIDECHVLTIETWNALLKILEEPPINVVFIMITTDPDRLPRTALSRCQKFPFPKIKDSEIIERLQKLASMENLSIDPEILKLIASRSDGSLRDAETTLDQVTLLGHHVDPSTVHELVGCASDDRILSLLDAALIADTVNTVRRARDLIDSGMEPLSLMSRLATVITDILAGSFKFAESQRKGFFRKQALSEERLERLRTAMKILAEAEKQLRVSNDRTTWLTAALLQLGPDRMCMFSVSCAGTSVTQSPVGLDDLGENETNDFELRSAERRTAYHYEQGFMEAEALHEPSYHGSEKSRLEDDLLDISCKDSNNEQRLSPTKLDDIWSKVMEKCRSLPLHHLLYSSVKLTSISITEVDATVHLEVHNPTHKSSCERLQKNITHLFEVVLGFPVEIKTSLASLPAEGGPARATQVCISRDEGEFGKHVHIHPEAATHQGYERRALESISKPTSAHQSHTVESFPAIASPSPQNQCYGASTRKNLSHQSVMHETKAQDSRGLLPKSGGTAASHRTHGQHHNHILAGTNDYVQDKFFEDVNNEDERIIAESQAMSPNSFEANGQHNRSRLRQARDNGPESTQSTYHLADDVERKRKGSNMKMVRRLSIRNQATASPKSDPNSPNERGGSFLRVPRFSSKSQTDAQKHRNPQSPKEPCMETEDLEEESVTQKKGKLKGAAGSFARFFQGKLNK
ncbi:hypothetical protein GOP47_0022793 [Adiantum capillus-veneris]|uniref:DNA-directed DNA polymerase n=1 Tax=Adiantum capillus-veneris TaxID=13818 RepID=A0A9D4U624_ADICA|nr:hypothetical protein GOP47_0022793 [Adiantum capillus-veneris]